MKWITFFSQTGSEIVELSNRLGRKPDLIVTNNFEEKIKFNPGIRELNVTILSTKHDGIMNYFRHQVIYKPTDIIITLHGYLRILSPDICDRYEIYNGHPAAINLYPELKGKDPQEKVWQNMSSYPIIGSVVHRCTSVLDAGEITGMVNIPNKCTTADSLYQKLKETSLESWLTFMKGAKI
jgi:folate-dependent phosphoribosylglycinamide formyltransferase PurN